MYSRIGTISLLPRKPLLRVVRLNGIRLGIIAGMFFAASVCAAVRSADFVTSAPRVAVVAATNPCLNATRLGFILGYNWRMSGPEFDFNETILSTVKGTVKREIKVMGGREVGLVVNSLELPRLKLWEEHYRTKMSELAASWEVDAILVIHGTEAVDWMGHSGTTVAGLGLFQGGRQHESYAVLALSIYDAREKRFHNAEVARKGRELPPVEWRKNWDDYTPHERTILIQCVRGAVEDGVAFLLGRAGLGPAVNEKLTLKKVFVGDSGKPWVPDGGQIKIPAGISHEVASAVVLGAFRTRGWQVSSNDSNRVVGLITRKKKEAIETAVIDGDTIVLTAEQFETQSNGERVSIAPHDRWHNNLKETIVEELFKFTPEVKVGP